MSYGELESRSNQLGRYLRRLGVRAESRVGVVTGRSIELPLMLLGVLKAGGAYVPLDPGYPEERLRYLLEDSGVDVLLTAGEEPSWARGVRIVRVREEWEEIARESDERMREGIGGEGLAYVTYTSGSTGEPKGVEVLQRGVLRLVFGTEYAEFGEGESFAQLAPVSFDASTFEIWGALLQGGRCVLGSWEGVGTGKEISELIEVEGVTTLWLTASLFNAVVEEDAGSLRGLKQLLIGGEALSVKHVKRAYEELRDVRIVNGYGPTEGTTFTCCYGIRRGRSGEGVGI